MTEGESNQKYYIYISDWIRVRENNEKQGARERYSERKEKREQPGRRQAQETQ